MLVQISYTALFIVTFVNVHLGVSCSKRAMLIIHTTFNTPTKETLFTRGVMHIIMPTVTIDGPEIVDVEIKRALVKEITDALERAYKIPREAYVVVIKENPPENVGVGGKLVANRR